MYFYYSQKSTLHQDVFQKVEGFSPGQNWDLQPKKNSIRRLAGKSGVLEAGFAKRSGHKFIVSNEGFSDYCCFDLKSLHPG